MRCCRPVLVPLLLVGLALACGCGGSPTTGPAPAREKPDPDYQKALPREGGPQPPTK